MRKSQKRPRKINRASKKCWLDHYSGAFFMGRLKRVYGPARIGVGRIGSLIVGPGALVVPASRNRQTSLRPLLPLQIIPDFATRKREGNLKMLQIVAGH
jgi:hypothetical protein